MVSRSRLAFAHGVLVVSAVAIAVATGWYFLGTGHHVTAANAVAPAAPKPTATGARLAADAFVGSIKAGDVDGVCALLTAQVRGQHPNCREWAQGFIGLTQEGRYLVLAVVMQPERHARVRVLIDGDHFFWYFVHQAGAWKFERAAAVPKA